MEFFPGISALKKALTQSAIVTIGNFDGVHRGHLEIVEKAKQLAHSKKGVLIAYTFRPHPQIGLFPERKLPLLCTYEERRHLLEKAGVDILIEEPFSREFSTTPAEVFFQEVLIHKLSAAGVVVGYDFGFGKNRGGHLEDLKRFCAEAGVKLEIVSPFREKQEVISSSRIRQHLLAGEIETANQLLGYSFFYSGVVQRGEGRGRKIGFPTANLKLGEKLVLPYGVYATWSVLGKETVPSVTNIGVRPTFESDQLEPLIETHLLDFDRDLYGVNLEVQFISRLRAEAKFAGIDALKTQIAKDCASARQILVRSSFK